MPDTCTECGVTTGTLYPHEFSADGVCAVCGKVREGTPLGVLRDFIIQNGEYDEELAAYSVIVAEDDYGIVTFDYYPEDPTGVIMSYMSMDDSFVYATLLGWFEGEANSEAITMVFDLEGTLYAMGSCYIWNNGFNRNSRTVIDYQAEPADSQVLEAVKGITQADIVEILYCLEAFLEEKLPDYQLSDYGFKSF